MSGDSASLVGYAESEVQAAVRQQVIAEGTRAADRLESLGRVRPRPAGWSQEVAAGTGEVCRLAGQAIDWLDRTRSELADLGLPDPLRGEVGGMVRALEGVATAFRATQDMTRFIGAVMTSLPPNAPHEAIDATLDAVAGLTTLFRDLLVQLEPIDTTDVRQSTAAYFDTVFDRLHADPAYRASIARGWTDYQQGQAVPLDDVMAELGDDP